MSASFRRVVMVLGHVIFAGGSGAMVLRPELPIGPLLWIVAALFLIALVLDARR